jgi:hypothetical protein
MHRVKTALSTLTVILTLLSAPSVLACDADGNCHCKNGKHSEDSAKHDCKGKDCKKGSCKHHAKKTKSEPSAETNQQQD